MWRCHRNYVLPKVIQSSLLGVNWLYLYIRSLKPTIRHEKAFLPSFRSILTFTTFRHVDIYTPSNWRYFQLSSPRARSIKFETSDLHCRCHLQSQLSLERIDKIRWSRILEELPWNYLRSQTRIFDQRDCRPRFRLYLWALINLCWLTAVVRSNKW